MAVSTPGKTNWLQFALTVTLLQRAVGQWWGPPPCKAIAPNVSVTHLGPGECFIDITSHLVEDPPSNLTLKCMDSTRRCVSSEPAHRWCNLENGNFACYQGPNSQLWFSSQTTGGGFGPWRLYLQDDGNLVIYDARGVATWSTGTNPFMNLALFLGPRLQPGTLYMGTHSPDHAALPAEWSVLAPDLEVATCQSCLTSMCSCQSPGRTGDYNCSDGRQGSCFGRCSAAAPFNIEDLASACEVMCECTSPYDGLLVNFTCSDPSLGGSCSSDQVCGAAHRFSYSDLATACLPLGRSFEDQLYDMREKGDLGPSTRNLKLARMGLHGALPLWLAEYRNLTLLDLNCNYLREVPEWIGNFTQLVTLSLWGNPLGRFPIGITRLLNLEVLDLGVSSMKGPIPPEIGRLRKLTVAFMHTNKLSGGIPKEVGNMTSLRQLRWENNFLTGQLPAEMGQMLQLEILSLGNNQLDGDIPPSLGSLRRLSSVSLEQNRLSGSIPMQLGACECLTVLNLGSNRLSGILPPQLGNLSLLGTLDLHKNMLSGQIPSSLGQLGSLQNLLLQENRFSGVLPTQLGLLYQLRNLALDHNLLEGQIPVALSRLVNLQSLTMSANLLTGPIPSQLSRLAQLQRLQLDQNKLTGEIPPGIGSLSSLKYLLLANNGLNGSVPATFQNLKKLLSLTVANNRLSGPLPSELESPEWWPFDFDISRNHEVTGSFPATAGSVLTFLRAAACSFDRISSLSSKLQVLDVSNNRLTELPEGFESLADLTDVNLASNRIHAWPPFGVALFRCGWSVLRAKRLPCEGLKRLDLSGNPIGLNVQELVDSLSYLQKLESLKAANCGLTGSWDDFEAGKENYDNCVEVKWPEMGFQGVSSVDLSGNMISAIRPQPPPYVFQADLSMNNITEIHPAWINLDATSAISFLNLRGNPSLHQPVLPVSAEGCQGSGHGDSKRLVADVTAFAPVSGTLFESASLCSWPDLELQFDSYSLNSSATSRCVPGAQGVATSCSRCPKDTFAPALLGASMSSECVACPVWHETQSVGSTGIHSCFCTRSIEGLQEIYGQCRCQANSYIDVAASACRPCPLFHSTESGATAIGLESCYPTLASTLLRIAVVLAVAAFAFVLPVCFSLPPMAVCDVSLQQDRTIVTTNTRHYLLRFACWPVPIVFYGTGHPLLDSGKFRASYRDAFRMSLSSSDGKPLGEPLDTAM